MKNLIIVGFVLLFFSCTNQSKDITPQHKYIKNSGFIHGTTYNIIYNNNNDLQEEIELQMHKVDKSLSTYDSTSVISLINRNKPYKLDKMFIEVFNKSQEIAKKTNGAFDITVAPLVNIWGFGFTNKNIITQKLIDSIMPFVGYKNIKLENNKIIKQNTNTMLDASAIAKGYSVDVVCDYLISKNINDFLVEIGGEVRCSGIKADSSFWKVGIDKPIDDTLVINRELQEIVQFSGKTIATSGNYRQFYYKDGVKYSHTINPKTGYPVNHSILSASVITDKCYVADAYATAFMVLGVEKAKKIAKELDYLEIYLIYTDETNTNKVFASDGFKKYLKKE